MTEHGPWTGEGGRLSLYNSQLDMRGRRLEVQVKSRQTYMLIRNPYC